MFQELISTLEIYIFIFLHPSPVFILFNNLLMVCFESFCCCLHAVMVARNMDLTVNGHYRCAIYTITTWDTNITLKSVPFTERLLAPVVLTSVGLGQPLLLSEYLDYHFCNVIFILYVIIFEEICFHFDTSLLIDFVKAIKKVKHQKGRILFIGTIICHVCYWSLLLFFCFLINFVLKKDFSLRLKPADTNFLFKQYHEKE